MPHSSIQTFSVEFYRKKEALQEAYTEAHTIIKAEAERVETLQEKVEIATAAVACKQEKIVVLEESMLKLR